MIDSLLIKAFTSIAVIVLKQYCFIYAVGDSTVRI